ncbi:glycosyltransferase family 2 protein [Polynucleobacter paneuropaeus]|nr:glycosyltransferase family 2 protein [Polynucleobacter paneuropaeus]
MKSINPIISLVVPVLNEENSIETFLSRIDLVFSKMPIESYEIIFINDGSADDTLSRLLAFKAKREFIKIIDLSRNFGKEAALTAGIRYSKGLAVIPIDVDLQDPPEVIEIMIEKWREGFEVVLGHRVDRDSDIWSKRFFSTWFYKVYNKLCAVGIPDNVGDFRLMDRSVVDALNTLPESQRFMKGLFAWVGFKTTSVDYARPIRYEGSSKFNFLTLSKLAIEGITSFSIVPLRIFSLIGVLISATSFFFGSYIVMHVILVGKDVPGYASLVVAVTFLGGLQLMAIGLIGEYMGRAYMETKRRPIYLVRKIY